MSKTLETPDTLAKHVLERATFPRGGIFVVFRFATVPTNATRPCDTH